MSEPPDYNLWIPPVAPTIDLWPPAEWLDGVIGAAIAHYVEGGFFHIRGDSLEFTIWDAVDSSIIAEKKARLSERLSDAITSGGNLPKLRAVLVAAIEELDQKLIERPHWAEPKAGGEK